MNKKLLEQRNNAIAKMEELVSTAKKENRALTNDELKEFNELKATVESIDETAKASDAVDLLNVEVTSAEGTGNDVKNKEAEDVKAFANFIRSDVQNTNANLTKGDNGAVIPATIANKIIAKVEERSPLYRLATHYNIKGTLTIPYVDTSTDDITVGWSTDFTAVDGHANKFSSISLTGFTYAAFTKISKSLLRNSDFDLVQFVIDRMADTLASFIENQLINGTENSLLGIARSYDSTNMKLTLAKKSSVTADELIELQSMVPAMYQANCGWIMKPQTFTKVRKLKDGQGNYLVIENFAKDGPDYTLLGRPVYPSENAPSLGTAGNLAIIYGDFSGLAVKESSEHEITIDNISLAPQGAMSVCLNGEIDSKVENAQKIACAACGSSD